MWKCSWCARQIRLILKRLKASSDPGEFRFGAAESANGNASSDSEGLPYRCEAVEIRRRQAIATVARKNEKAGHLVGGARLILKTSVDY